MKGVQRETVIECLMKAALLVDGEAIKTLQRMEIDTGCWTTPKLTVRAAATAARPVTTRHPSA